MKNITKIIITLLALSFFSCSANYHLKESKKEYEKAIRKGYKPLLDSIKSVSRIKPVEIKLVGQKRSLIVNTIDSLLLVNDCLDTVVRTQIVRVVDTAIKYISIDTVMTLDSGGKMFLKIHNGEISAKVENVSIKENIYIETIPLWVKIVLGAMLGFIILLILVRRIK